MPMSWKSGVVMAMLVTAGVFGLGDRVAAQGASAPAATGPAVQRVEIEVTGRGYEPSTVELRAGVPADLVFTRTTGSGCAGQVQIKELGVEPTVLPQGEPVTIRITVPEPGRYTFACGMNMLKGTIVAK